jgi:hypothetical protein
MSVSKKTLINYLNNFTVFELRILNKYMGQNVTKQSGGYYNKKQMIYNLVGGGDSGSGRPAPAGQGRRRLAHRGSAGRQMAFGKKFSNDFVDPKITLAHSKARDAAAATAATAAAAAAVMENDGATAANNPTRTADDLAAAAGVRLNATMAAKRARLLQNQTTADDEAAKKRQDDDVARQQFRDARARARAQARAQANKNVAAPGQDQPAAARPKSITEEELRKMLRSLVASDWQALEKKRALELGGYGYPPTLSRHHPEALQSSKIPNVPATAVPAAPQVDVRPSVHNLLVTKKGAPLPSSSNSCCWAVP